MGFLREQAAELALRGFGAELEEAFIMRHDGPEADVVILQDGRTFPVPGPEELPHRPGAAAAIVELARQRERPQADDVVGDLPEPINHQPSLPKGFSARVVDGPWETYATGDGWQAYEPNAALFDNETYDNPAAAGQRVNFLNMLASGEPIKAV